MSEQCNHDCSSCSENCDSRTNSAIQKLQPHQNSKIKKVIGVVSGKGGVGKSLVSGLLAVELNRRGLSTAVLDADITGPSIPTMFGIHEKAHVDELGCHPALTKTKIKVMSVNMLLEDATDPVVWRGPIIAQSVRQFWQEVVWQDVDYMFVDMPPGTGDVPLTVFQNLPIDGIVVVTSPQQLVSTVVGKAVKMANLMNIPIIGVIENMSYVQCPDCDKKIFIYGESKINEVCDKYNLPILAQIPIIQELAMQCDKGVIESYEGDFLQNAADKVEGI